LHIGSATLDLVLRLAARLEFGDVADGSYCADVSDD